LIKELGCGRIVSRPNVSTVELEVTKLSDLTEIIIPLFSKYSAPRSAFKEIKLMILMILKK
jgi:hypothetical protein